MTQTNPEISPKKQKRKFELHAFYKIVWQDIVTDVGWTSAKGEKLDLAECVTYGWATDIGRKGIRFSATVGDNKDGSDLEYNQHIVIPRGCILRAERIEAP